MYWANFWQPTIHVQQSIVEETLAEVCSPNFCAYFGTFRAQIGLLFEAQCIFRDSKKIDVRDIFLRIWRFVDFQTYFKDSLYSVYNFNLMLDAAYMQKLKNVQDGICINYGKIVSSKLFGKAF